MALKGRVEDYGLADLFQLLLASRKAGVLLLENDLDEIRVYVRDGWVLDVENELRPTDAALASRLRRAGYLGEAAFGQVLKKRAETGLRMGDIVTELGYAPPDVVRQHATLLAQDALYEPFTWPSGTYAFEEGSVSDRNGWAEPVSLDTLLLNGIGLASDWPQIQKRIPSPLWVVARRWELPPERDPFEVPTFSDVTGMAPHAEDEELGPGEREIHDMCDPGMEVQALLELGPMARFETLRALSILIGKGYLRLSPPIPRD